MITMSPGHFGIGTGAVGLIDEVEEAIKVVNEVARLLKAKGIEVHKVIDNTSKNKRDNLRFLQHAHASTSRQVDVFVHFNATAKPEIRAIGTEVFYNKKEMEPLAKHLSQAISEAAGFKNRGAKMHEQLYVLNTSSVGGVLLEICFVNSKQDVKLYKQHFHAICFSIANELQRFIVGQRTANNLVQQFSSKTLAHTFQVLSEDNRLKQKIVQNAINEKVIQPIWQQKLKQGTVTQFDVCAISLLLLKKQIF